MIRFLRRLNNTRKVRLVCVPFDLLRQVYIHPLYRNGGWGKWCKIDLPRRSSLTSSRTRFIS